MGLTRLAVDRPILVLMALGALLLFGLYGYRRMPAELDPRVVLPIVNVTVILPAASPEEVENRVTRPIEEAVASINRVRDVYSTSLENAGNVTVRFEDGTDPDAAAAEVRARVEAVRRDLPEEARTPVVNRIDVTAQPVLTMAASFRQASGGVGKRGSGGVRSPDSPTSPLPHSPASEEELAALTDVVEEQVREPLNRVDGVAAVRMIGGWEQEVLVSVDPRKLQQHGLSITDVLAPLRASNLSVAAGALHHPRQRRTVRVSGEFRSLEAIGQVPVIPLGGGRGGGMAGMGAGGMAPPARTAPSPPVLLRELATIRFQPREREMLARVNRQPGIMLQVVKLGEANTVQVVDRVLQRVREVEQQTARLGRPVELHVLQDQSVGVRDALGDIQGALLLGCLFAVLVVYLFLHNFRETLIVAIQLPASIICTFGVMWLAGFTLNQMTMLAIALGIGILVDDSILVLDSINRHRRMGKSPRDAALEGRQEIGLADATNSFLDVVVYVPVALMGGVIGMYFKQFGLTVATASLFSLLVAFTVTPMLAARWFREGEDFDRPRREFGARFDRAFRRLQRFYRGRLQWALRHRALVVTLGFGSLGLVVLLATRLGREFVPSVDRGQVVIALETQPGLSLAATEQVVRRVEETVARSDVREAIDLPTMFTTVGEVGGGGERFPLRGPQFAEISLRLKSKADLLGWLTQPLRAERRRTISDEEVAARLRQQLQQRKPADLQEFSVSAARSMTGGGAPISLHLYGREGETQQLVRAAEEIADAWRRVEQPGRGRMLLNVESSYRKGLPEVAVVVDRDRATELGVMPAEAAQAARTALEGNTDVQFRQGAEAYPVRVQVDPGALQTPADLQSLIVTQRGGSPVYMDELGQFVEQPGPVRLMREDRQPVVRVTAYPAPGVDLSRAASAARMAVDAVRRQSNTTVHAFRPEQIKWSGDVEGMSKSFQDALWALVFAIALSYMLMAVLFNSLVSPLVIMLTVPMALVGAILALLLTGTTLSTVAMVGIVMLVGLVAKNAILLVDYTNTLRHRDGYERDAAICEAGPVRLRPIVMTTVSTILASLPVALGVGAGAEIRAPMGIVVIGGLLLASLLTLFVIPVVYTYADEATDSVLRGWERLMRRWMPRRPGPPAGGDGAGRVASEEEPRVPIGGRR